ncbi:helix-turn-helix domain-containing protein [Weissella sagaensis]|uniref:helix-turn-helix domain-containing protein n=1 Tax=Weissella sagaensis TaxID=2559928 RepID=UPI001C200050|nr:helix-turn-helix transcriptional regulator [Weissella sagaensis]MBU7568661.1 helix-turn-helix transcriptional regulator [Weissella hellenica]
MNKIKELRKQKHYTLQNVADAIGVSNGTVANYENGKREPKLATWQKLADFFDVDVGYLQGVTDYENANDLINKIASIENNEEKIEFIKHLSLNDKKLIAYANDQEISDSDTLEMIIKIMLSDTLKYSKQFSNILEVIDKNLYSRTLTKLAQRDDDIDEDEKYNITYKNEFDLVYYLNLVQDNLSTLKRDKVTAAISALKDVLNDDSTTVSAELSAYLKKVRDYY